MVDQQKLGIQKLSKCIDEVGEIVKQSIALFKDGKSMFAMFKLASILSDVRDLVADASAACPELKDLDPEEMKLLTEKSYEMVKKIMDALK